jgi:hypothetical protein
MAGNGLLFFCSIGGEFGAFEGFSFGRENIPLTNQVWSQVLGWGGQDAPEKPASR